MWLLIVRRAGKDLIFSKHESQESAISEREYMLDRRAPTKHPIRWTAIVLKKDGESVSV